MSQSKKNNKGFTLVEVIVVAVIVAILAAVAIPIYQQYVIDSRNNSAQNAGGSIASFMGACVASSGSITTALSAVEGPQDITCTKATGNTVIAIPRKVQITIANVATSGNVVAKHAQGDSTYTYKY